MIEVLKELGCGAPVRKNISIGNIPNVNLFRLMLSYTVAGMPIFMRSMHF